MIRGNKGLPETCKVSNLVVGDIITIEAGMRIPADCILIEGMDVKCDESMYKEGTISVDKKISTSSKQH